MDVCQPCAADDDNSSDDDDVEHIADSIVALIDGMEDDNRDDDENSDVEAERVAVNPLFEDGDDAMDCEEMK